MGTILKYILYMALFTKLLFSLSCTTTSTLHNDRLVDAGEVLMPESEITSNEGGIFTPKPGEKFDEKQFYNNQNVMTGDLILGYYPTEQMKLKKDEDEDEEE